MMRGFVDLLRRFRNANSGVAAVEFALIFPVMILVYFGTMEASALISMDRKVQSVAGAVGDLVARSNGTISTATMQDYFRAAGGIMTPYSSTPILQVITAVNVTNAGVATVAWSRQYRNGTMSATTPRRPGAAFPLPAEMIAIARGQIVIAAEVTYDDYRPLYGIVFDQTFDLYRSSFYMPRFGGTIVVTN